MSLGVGFEVSVSLFLLPEDRCRTQLLLQHHLCLHITMLPAMTLKD